MENLKCSPNDIPHFPPILLMTPAQGWEAWLILLWGAKKLVAAESFFSCRLFLDRATRSVECIHSITPPHSHIFLFLLRLGDRSLLGLYWSRQAWIKKHPWHRDFCLCLNLNPNENENLSKNIGQLLHIFLIFLVFSCLCVTPQLPYAPNEGGNVAASSFSLCLSCLSSPRTPPPTHWQSGTKTTATTRIAFLGVALGPSLLYIDLQSCRT